MNSLDCTNYLGEDEDFGIHLRLLRDILESKKDSLCQIANICENQQFLSETTELNELTGFIEPAEFSEISEADSKNEILFVMSREKQKLVEKVQQCDEVFNKTFEKIKQTFELNAIKYKSDVKYIQLLIKNVTELDIKIRNLENISINRAVNNTNLHNHYNYHNKKNINISVEPSLKNYILKQYEKNKKNSGYSDY